MALIPNPAATPEEIEAHLRLLRQIELGRHRDDQQAFKQVVASMRKAATHALAPPTLTSLEPSSTPIGVPSFTLRVLGTDFDDESVIVFNGHDEPTTLVSPTEVTTGVNMNVWKGPSDPLPVKVRGIGGDSTELTFTFLPAEPEGEAPAGVVAAKQNKKPVGGDKPHAG